jgi:hypothetical protein
MSNSFFPHLTNLVVFWLAHGSSVATDAMAEVLATSIPSGNEMISNRCQLYMQGK